MPGEEEAEEARRLYALVLQQLGELRRTTLQVAAVRLVGGLCKAASHCLDHSPVLACRLLIRVRFYSRSSMPCL